MRSSSTVPSASWFCAARPASACAGYLAVAKMLRPACQRGKVNETAVLRLAPAAAEPLFVKLSDSARRSLLHLLDVDDQEPLRSLSGQ